jgi:predicted esterase
MAGDPPTRRPLIIVPPPVPSSTAPATLIFIHGYNALNTQFNCDPPNASSVAYHIYKSLALQHVKIVIPEGIPSLWPSMNKATWYNMAAPVPQPGSPQNVYEQIEFGHSGSNEDDMNLNLDYFESLIKSEIAGGTPAKGITFVGYSQGATILTLFIVTRKLAADLGQSSSLLDFLLFLCSRYQGCNRKMACLDRGVRPRAFSCCMEETMCSSRWNSSLNGERGSRVSEIAGKELQMSNGSLSME